MRPRRSMSFSRKPAFTSITVLLLNRDFSTSLGMRERKARFHKLTLPLNARIVEAMRRLNCSNIQRFNFFTSRRHLHRQHFHAQIIQYHGREDQTRDAHESFAKDQSD